MLFRPENAPKIIRAVDPKTVTRRVARADGRRPAVPGRIIEARTRLFVPEAVFAFLVVRDIRKEQLPGEYLGWETVLGDLYIHPQAYYTREDVYFLPETALLNEAKGEGFESWDDFRAAYAAMHGERALGAPCWRIAFRLATMHEALCHAPDTRAARMLAAETVSLPAADDDKPAVCPWFEVAA